MANKQDERDVLETAGERRDSSERSDQDGASRLEELFNLGSIDAPQVSPERDEVAFIADINEQPAVYTLPVDGGSLTCWSDDQVHPVAPGGMCWNGDGSRLYVFSRTGGEGYDGIVECLRDSGSTTILETTANVLLVAANEDRILYASNTDGEFKLYRYDREHDSRDRLADQIIWPMEVYYSRAREAIAFSSAASDDSNIRDVYTVDTTGGDPSRLAIGSAATDSKVGDWFPDGRRLLIGENTTNGGRVGVFDCEDDTVRWLSDDSAAGDPAAVSPDGTYALSLRKQNAALTPVVYDLDERMSRELAGLDGISTVAGGRESGFVTGDSLVLKNQSGSRLDRIVRYELSDGSVKEMYSVGYGSFEPSSFVEPEYVTYESEDGLDIGAVLYEPPARNENDPGSAVVLIHGGPHIHAKQQFDPLVQELLNSGMAVLQPNYRGSTGRGQSFKNRLEDGGWGGMEQVDIRRGAEVLAERASVNSERIGCFGRSFGGYSVVYQLTMYPEPWACGVAMASITDLLAYFDEASPSVQATLEEMFGTPAENEGRYRERSPVENAEALEAPFKLIHGADDQRSPVTQARALRDALVECGRNPGQDSEFEYIEIDGLGHRALTVEQQCQVGELVVDFFQRRLD